MPTSEAYRDVINIICEPHRFVLVPCGVDLQKRQVTPAPMMEEDLLAILQNILRHNPTVVHEQDDRGYTLLHHAASYLNTPSSFFEALVEFDPSLQSVKTFSHESEVMADVLPFPGANFDGLEHDGCLPFHIACIQCNVLAAKYLLHIYPQSIDMSTRFGRNSLEVTLLSLTSCSYRGDFKAAPNLIAFLLQHKPDLISTHGICGNLPLHIICKAHMHDVAKQEFLATRLVKKLYDIFPEAMFMKNGIGETPINGNPVHLVDINRYALGYLAGELMFVAQYRHVVTIPDENGQLPLHHLLSWFRDGNYPALGTIKLITSAYPGSTRMVDNSGRIPLHVACTHLPWKTEQVAYLIDFDESTLQIKDDNDELPLHIACRNGTCALVSWILDKPSNGVAVPKRAGQLPIEMFLYQNIWLTSSVRNSLEYVQAVNDLLRANPGSLAHLIG